MEIIRTLIPDLEEIINSVYPKSEFPRIIFPDIEVRLSGFIKERLLDIKKIEKKKINRKDIKRKISPKYLIDKYPGVLIMIYFDLIKRIIFKKTKNRGEFEDILHKTIEILLEKKLSGIKKRFNFDESSGPTFTSYFLVTIRNILIDEQRKRKMDINYSVDPNDMERFPDTRGMELSGSIILKEELKKLGMIFSLFRKSREKLLTILKIIHLNEPGIEEIKNYLKNCSRTELQVINAMEPGQSLKSIFEQITPLFNKQELSPLKPDSLRKWTSVKIEEIVRLMNKTHNDNPYNTSNISELLSIYINGHHYAGRKKNVL